jgi:hypothetical protein
MFLILIYCPLSETFYIHMRNCTPIYNSYVHNWRINLVLGYSGGRKALTALYMLVWWTIWNEWKARTFRDKSTMPTITFNSIKLDARSLVFAIFVLLAPYSMN